MRTTVGVPMAPAGDELACLDAAAGSERAFSVTRNTTPAASTAAIISRASATEFAIGFCTETCLPARAAAITWSLCMNVGVRISTASISSSASIASSES